MQILKTSMHLNSVKNRIKRILYWLSVIRWVSLRWIGVMILMVLSMATLLTSRDVAIAIPTTHEHLHAQPGAGGVTTYTHENESAVSIERLHEIDQMLNEAKTATEKYRDVNVALADGYRQQGPSLRGAGAHFVNRDILDAGVFDIAHPTFLLYERQTDWSFEFVGIGWLLPKASDDDTPPPYFAPLADWHYHDYPAPGICFWENGTSDRYAEESCTSEGGMFWAHSPWMLHAWLYRASPEGIFSLVNSAVDGIQVDENFVK